MRRVFQNIVRVAVLVGMALVATAQTNRTVLPPGFENQPGGAYDPLFISSQEFQQIFRASATFSGPVEITGIAFRVGSNLGSSFSAVIPRVEIRLSTSSRAPEAMTTSWASNRGSDETIVFSQNNVAFSGAGDQSINPFALRLIFSTPFLYNREAGHLAMDIRTTVQSGPGNQTIDAKSFQSLSTSPVGSVIPTADPLLHLVAPYGLITEFSWTAIPEPTTVGFPVSALSVFLISRGKQLSKRGKT
jgi:hypothetical protein